MKLKFKQQKYQNDAAQAVVDCFIGQTKGKRKELLGRGVDKGQSSFIEDIAFSNKSIELTDFDILKNVQNVQKSQGLVPSKKLAGMDFTIEMETGTGKTYVYTKTMYELNKYYGWSKFIIMVPSIAIREGVNKSLQITAEHFQEIYGKKIRFNIYDARKTNNINNIKTFASSSAIEVIIMNYQAFAARSEDAKRIYMRLDEMQSRKPIDVLKSTRPILIIDEPQKFGKQANESIAKFNSLFKLRYSATHKEDFNKIYRLDAVDAFNQKLVKKISVKGVEVLGDVGTNSYLFLDRIDISDKVYPKAKLEFEVKQNSGIIKRILRIVSEGDDLYQLSGELNQYRGFVINSINGLTNTISFTNGITMDVGQVSGGLDEKHLRRIQIRETIKSHLDKEKILFNRGIKVLSLFFIDEVAKYRQYGENGKRINGEYADIFEEEYRNALTEYRDLFNPEYNRYLDNSSVSKIHNGYFSIDKKGRFVDSSEKRGEDGSSDTDAYDLIMKNKEKLLGFEEPTRFIFSHSALREGWDNQNIFQICTLKHAQSNISKRQEIGRGLRICVDKEGERMDSNYLEDEFFDINNLTIIASESYDQFARDLQKEILDSLSDRPIILSSDILKDRVLRNEKGEEFVFDSKDAMDLIFLFKENKYIDEEYRITEKLIEDIEKNVVVLPQGLSGFKKEVSELMNKIYSTSKLKDEITNDERKNNISEFKLTDNFQKKEFQDLWNKIKVKTVYEVDFDSEELIKKSIDSININLKVKKAKAIVTTGTQEEEMNEENLKNSSNIKKIGERVERVESLISDNIKYDLIDEITRGTILTRKSVVKILQGLKEDIFYQYKINPEDFIKQISNLISNEKAATLINSIIYSKTDNNYSDDIFTVNNLNGSLGDNVIEVKKHIYNYLKIDSDIEKKFANDLESGEVVVYAKPPRDFKIPTPVGNYNPDWAIVFDNNDFKYIYFIAETKGTMNTLEFREVEK
ncbi:MAG: DEAD/DEAH box helicase family protein, partial [Patescibacteria group bacterium]|nr:DEAD/DEAH box helicase family protein [Patescibacteria group bacterium]